jgi:acetate kinase
MLVLVANLGSTSFKFKLLDMNSGGLEVVARGGYERIGQAGSPYKAHGDVIDVILKDLADKKHLPRRDRLQGRAWRADFRRGARHR